MSSRKFTVAGMGFVLVAAVVWLSFAPQSTDSPRLSGSSMGTSYSVLLRSCDYPTDCAALADKIAARLQQLEARFSHYLPDSELSAFNQHISNDWFAVDQELFAVIDYAMALSWESNGAFDITIAPLIEAWGFGTKNIDTPPSAATIADLQQQTGYKKLQLRAEPPSLKKLHPELMLDLSAIAKGYAVDQIALLMEAQSISDYMVEIGGEIRTAGMRRAGVPWRIGIEPPAESMRVNFILNPGNNAVATSGDYRNYFEYDGQRYSHTLDPRTGYPVRHELAAVTVIQPSAIQADVLATALMVLGPEAGFQYAVDNAIPALFWVRNEKGLGNVYTEAFGDYLFKD